MTSDKGWEQVELIRVLIMSEAYDCAERSEVEAYNSIKVMCSEVLDIVMQLIENEREECARLCETPIDEIQITDDISEFRYMDAQECAATIRARGTE